MQSGMDPLSLVGPGLPASFLGGHYMTVEGRTALKVFFIHMDIWQLNM